MSIVLFACLTPECLTVYFKTADGHCPRCGLPGQRVVWGLVQRRPPTDPRE